MKDEKALEELECEKISPKELRKKILSMILPITIESMLQMSAGFISTGMIGRLGDVAISSLGLGTRLINIVWALFKGIAMGTAVFVAQAYGAGNHKKIRHVLKQSILSLVFLSIIFQQILFWLSPKILKLFFNPEPELLQNATEYIRIASFCLPFLSIMLVIGASLQAMGNAKTPMKIAFMLNLTNIAVGYTFITGQLGMSPLGIKGAAIGYVVAHIVAAGLGLNVVFGKRGILGKGNEKLAVDIKQIKDVYRVGFPTAIEQLLWQLAAVVLTRTILAYGTTSLAAYQLGLQAESIAYMPAVGFGIAATAFIGQAVGAQNPKIGRMYMKELIKGSILITAFCASLLIFLPDKILLLLTNDPEIIKIAVVYLVAMGIVQIPQNISGVLNGALRGAGYVKVPMYVAFVGLWGVRVLFSVIFTNFFNMNVNVIWFVIAADLIVRFIVSFTIYKRKNIYEGISVVSEA